MCSKYVHFMKKSERYREEILNFARQRDKVFHGAQKSLTLVRLFRKEKNWVENVWGSTWQRVGAVRCELWNILAVC